MNQTLIISLPRGLYRLTKCEECKFIFKCKNCDNNLTTLKHGNKNILVCSECQTVYPYPKVCPSCNSKEVMSQYGGRQYLEDQLTNSELKADVSNRLFDPILDYKQYSRVFITHSENLFLGIDYASIEEVAKSITELMLNLSDDTEVIFDHKQGLESLEGIHNPLEWYRTIMVQEQSNRAKFFFPPANNLILISANEKTSTQSFAKLTAIRNELIHLRDTQLPELGLPSHPYEARMLRRKGVYTMHMYLKFPKNYPNITLLNNTIKTLKNSYRVTIRLNPRHIL